MQETDTLCRLKQFGVVTLTTVLLAACASSFNLAHQEQTCGEQTETFQAFGDCMKTAVAGPSQTVKPGSREDRFMRLVDKTVIRYEAGVVDLDAAMREYMGGRAELQAEAKSANDEIMSSFMNRLMTGGGGSQPSQESVHAVAAAILSGSDRGTYGSPGSLGTDVDRTYDGFSVEQAGRLPMNVQEVGSYYVMNTRDGKIRFRTFMDTVTIEYPNGTSERCIILASFLNCD